MPNSRRLKAVLFDLDDTLVDRQASLRRYLDRLCRDLPELPQHIPATELCELVISSDNGGYLEPGEQHLRVREKVSAAIVSRLPGRHRVSRSDIEEHWRTRFPCSSLPMPGATALLRELSKRGIALAVVSNGSQRSRELSLSSLPFARLVDRVYSSGMVGVKKPDPRIFHHVLEDLGLHASDTWFVGDHPVNDIIGATAAGMTAIWLEGFHPWPADCKGPRHSVRHLGEVLSRLEM